MFICCVFASERRERTCPKTINLLAVTDLSCGALKAVMQHCGETVPVSCCSSSLSNMTQFVLSDISALRNVQLIELAGYRCVCQAVKSWHHRLLKAEFGKPLPIVTIIEKHFNIFVLKQLVINTFTYLSNLKIVTVCYIFIIIILIVKSLDFGQLAIQNKQFQDIKMLFFTVFRCFKHWSLNQFIEKIICRVTDQEKSCYLQPWNIWVTSSELKWLVD